MTEIDGLKAYEFTGFAGVRLRWSSSWGIRSPSAGVVDWIRGDGGERRLAHGREMELLR